MGAQLSHEPLEQNVARDQYPGGSGSGPAGAPPVDAPPGSLSRRLSIRKSRKKRKAERLEASAGGGGRGPPTLGAENHHKQHKRMDRLRRSFRDSFRRKHKEHSPESARPHQWQSDEKAVRDGTCSFIVKYQGCVQVYESRGMQVCEDALKLVRSQRRRAVRAVLYVSGDGLRVVDSETRDLLVDQTIEKVSFCAPDRNHERGFSYICRDGTTRRWMCHCFLAIRESGDRLSHAVGCAFAACLERKQKRDKECAVSMTVDPATSSFTRFGSFRQGTITDRLADPQELKPAEPVPVMPVNNPFAVERPRAPAAAVGLFERQGSLRVKSGRQQEVSPFKRQYSLRLNELPSNLERQGGGRELPRVEPIPESEETDNVTLLCRELSHGIDLLSDTAQNPSSVPCSPEPIAEEPSPVSEEPVHPDEWLQSLTNGSTSPEPAAPSPQHGEADWQRTTTSNGSRLNESWKNGDPFDAEWEQIAERNNQTNVNKSTNPFAKGGPAKLFEVHM